MSTSEGPKQPFTGELVPFPVTDRLPGIPTPVEMRDQLLDMFNRAVTRERTERGEVTSEADVWRMVRAVEGFRELVADYSRAFKHVADSAKAVHEEELQEVVPEQDGIPMGALNVPDGDGSTIRVSAKTENRHDIDRDQVVSALAALVAEEWHADEQRQAPAAAPEEYAIAVALRALDMVGASTLKVTQVRALAARLGQLGADRIAALVLDAIRTRRIYKGVDVDRKAS